MRVKGDGAGGAKSSDAEGAEGAELREGGLGWASGVIGQEMRQCATHAKGRYSSDEARHAYA